MYFTVQNTNKKIKDKHAIRSPGIQINFKVTVDDGLYLPSFWEDINKLRLLFFIHTKFNFITLRPIVKYIF